MESVNTVIITVDEYFELRQKAEMNGMLMHELGELRGWITHLEEKLNTLEYEVRSK